MGTEEGVAVVVMRYRVLSGVLGVLGFVLLLCSTLGVTEYSLGTVEDLYYIASFVATAMVLLSAILCTCVFMKAARASSVNYQNIKELGSAISGQYYLSLFLCMVCATTAVVFGLGGLSGDADDGAAGLNKALSVIIICCCILTFCVCVFSMCTVCSYGGYFGVQITKRGQRGIVAITTPGDESNTGRAMTVHNTHIFTTNVTNRQSNSQLEEQNRLLQQQLELQQQLAIQQPQQQQQQAFSGGSYPPMPPPAYSDTSPAYPPGFPPSSSSLDPNVHAPTYRKKPLD